MRWKRAVFLFTAPLIFAVMALATIFGNVRGVIHDPDHRPVEGVAVILRAANSDWSTRGSTNASGEFEFPAVPVGEYHITVSREGFGTIDQTMLVSSGSAGVLHFQLQLAASRQSVEVSEQVSTVNLESATPSVLIDRKAIEHAPGADRTNSLAMITNFVPGAYMTHDQLHIRGGHQVTWAVDGVPVPNTNIASNVGPQFDPKDADYIEVQRGGYSAEYGDRAYGVFNVIPRTGFERNREGELVASYGSFHQTNDQLSFGSHTQRFAYYAAINGNRSDFGLATPGPEVLHDRVSGVGGFGSLIFNPNSTNQLRVVGSLRRDDYQIPNDSEQDAAGIRDVERENDAFVNFSWVHTAGPGLLLTVTPFYHFNRANYIGGPGDMPVSATDNHASLYAGGQISLSATRGKHNARAGLYAFGQRDKTLFGLVANDGSGLSLQQSRRLSGQLEALFVEDQYKPWTWLTLTGGLRLTHFGGTISENAASPRAGAALRIPRLGWVLRGFYGRYYQAPPLSTVSGPLLDLALDQGFGFLPLRGERNEEAQVGLAIPYRGWTLDLNASRNRARNYFDHEALGNSNIFFPLTIQGARIRALEATLTSPRLLHRGQIHIAYAILRLEGFGGVTGGLTDFSPPEGVFLLDHDQHHTLNAGFEVNLPRRTWLAANLYFGSGFPDGEGPERLQTHTTVDVSLGKAVGENWSFSLHALNAANRRFLLDNSETFGGTHYADPRQIYVQVRYRFHY